MSLIQTRAQTSLLSMISDERYVLDGKAQRSVAEWAVLFAMVATHVPGQEVIPQTERTAFYRGDRLTENWRVWVGRYRGTAWRERHEWVKRALTGQGEGNEPDVHYSLVQLTFVVGACVLQIVYVPARELYLDPIFYGLLRGLLPLTDWSIPILRRPSFVFFDEGMKIVTQYLIRHLEETFGAPDDRRLHPERYPPEVPGRR
jgi:hypothetical protein